jgi:hypothetical protein
MSATSDSSGVKSCTDIVCPNEVSTLSALQRVFVHGKSQTCITGQASLGRELNTTYKVEPDQTQKGPVCRLQGYTHWTTFLSTTL